jgi:hypothetical protein
MLSIGVALNDCIESILDCPSEATSESSPNTEVHGKPDGVGARIHG